MKSISAALQYHQLTSYKFENVQYLYKDFSLRPQPAAVKTFPDAEIVQLPGNFSRDDMNYEAVRKKTSEMGSLVTLKSRTIRLDEFSKILYLTFGATLFREYATRKVFFRAAPSAGGLYPTDLYIFIRDVHGIKPGLYYFDAEKHQLAGIKIGEFSDDLTEICFALNSFSSASFSVIFVSNISRNMEKYRERALRYAWLDCGYVVENFTLATASTGLHCNLIGDFFDLKLSELLGLNGTNEFPVLIAAAGMPGASELHQRYVFSKPNTSEIIMRKNIKLADVNSQMCHFPAGLGAADISVSLPNTKLADNFPPTNKADTGSSEIAAVQRSLSDTIEQRRSAHHFVNAPVDGAQIQQIISSLKHTAALYQHPFYQTILAVNSVHKLTPGLYHVDRKSGNIQILKEGIFRGNLTYLSVAQDVVYKSAAMVLFAIDFEKIRLFSERGYRYALVNIGMASENVYLAANTVGLGARGIATFFDREFNEFLGLKSPHQNLIAGVIIGQI